MNYDSLFVPQFEDNIETAKKILKLRFKETPKAYVHSFGCQQNVSDGEHIMGVLASMGFSFCCEEKEADLILYNTCAVRESAEDKVFGHIGELKALKAKNKNLIVVISGCMTQRQEVRDRIHVSYPFVDIVFGTNGIKNLPLYLIKRIRDNKKIENGEELNLIEEGMPVIRESSYKAWLPIMQGCNNFCSYCIVPYVKGREVSRSPEMILGEAYELVQKGYKEITLLGQNVNSYGRGLDVKIDFPSLIKKLDAIEGNYTVKFMTSHPKDCTRELIDAVGESVHFAKHFHLPVQSGSNEILNKMNRNYTAEDYLSLIDYARTKIPNATFSADIIVGFPNESEEDFLKTIELIKKVRYNALYTFIYSKRSGTPAALIEDRIPYEEKAERMSRLLKVQRRINEEINNEMVGSVIKVLFDGISKNPNEIVGRTEGNIIAVAKGNESFLGEFKYVKILEAAASALQGEITEPI